VDVDACETLERAALPDQLQPSSREQVHVHRLPRWFVLPLAAV
jgi:hypothetical protein